VKLERHIVGWVTVPAAVIRRDDDPQATIRMPVPVYVIETETERILVDTGMHPAAVADPEAHYGRPGALGPFVAEQEASVADRVDLGTLTTVVLTHLHFDHASGLALVPERVPLVISRTEWEAGHDEAAIARNFFLPADYGGTEREVRLVDGEHDLLGDGSVTLLPTPGHTPGHQSVRVAERLVIGGDVVHFASGHRSAVVVLLTTDGLFVEAGGGDLQHHRLSADRLRGLRDAGLTILPGHDPDVLVPGTVAI